MKKVLLVLTTLLLTLNLSATEIEAFSPNKFMKAQKEGKTILLDFKASWCSTCKTQGVILKDILQKHSPERVAAFEVDYDNSEALQEKFNVVKQSTLIVLKGDKEINRSLGVTSKDKISKQIMEGL